MFSSGSAQASTSTTLWCSRMFPEDDLSHRLSRFCRALLSLLLIHIPEWYGSSSILWSSTLRTDALSKPASSMCANLDAMPPYHSFQPSSSISLSLSSSSLHAPGHCPQRPISSITARRHTEGSSNSRSSLPSLSGSSGQGSSSRV